MIESFKEDENPLVVKLTFETHLSNEPITGWFIDIYADNVEEGKITDCLEDLYESMGSAIMQVESLLEELRA